MIDTIHVKVGYTLDPSDPAEQKDLQEFIEAIKSEQELKTVVLIGTCTVCVQIRYYTHLFPEKLRALFDRMAEYIDALSMTEVKVEA